MYQFHLTNANLIIKQQKVNTRKF